MKALFTGFVFLIATVASASAQVQPPALVAAANAYAKLTGYHTTAHVFQVDGAQSQNNVYDFAFTKPTSIALNVVSGPNAGTNVAWTGGATVQTQQGRTLDLTDPAVLSLRGMTVVQLSFGSILQHAAETAGTLSSGTTSLGGATVNMINLNVANPHGDADLTREVLYLSQSTNLPVRADGFIGAQLVQTVSFENTTTTP